MSSCFSDSVEVHIFEFGIHYLTLEHPRILIQSICYSCVVVMIGTEYSLSVCVYVSVCVSVNMIIRECFKAGSFEYDLVYENISKYLTKAKINAWLWIFSIQHSTNYQVLLLRYIISATLEYI